MNLGIAAGTKTEMTAPPRATLVGGLDDGFPARVLRTSVWLAVAVLTLATLEQAWPVVIGFGAGAAINLGAFLALDGTLGSLIGAVARQDRAGRWFWTAVAFFKFPVLVASMVLSIWLLDMNYIAFAAGLGLVQAVMISKVGSLVMVDAINRWIPPPPRAAEILRAKS